MEVKYEELKLNILIDFFLEGYNVKGKEISHYDYWIDKDEIILKLYWVDRSK